MLLLKKTFIALLAFGAIHFSWAETEDEKDLRFMNRLEFKLIQREPYIKILREKGPEAYIQARKLKLPAEDRKAFLKDLAKIMVQNEVSKVSIDREKKLLVIENGGSRRSYEIRALREGYLKKPNSNDITPVNTSYANLRTTMRNGE